MNASEILQTPEKIRDLPPLPKYNHPDYGRIYRLHNAERLRQRSKEYRERNLEKLRQKDREKYQRKSEYYKEKSRKWIQENKDRHNARCKEWASSNPDKIKSTQKKFSENNRGKVLKWKSEWRENNRDLQNALVAEWGKKNPGKIRSYLSKRRKRVKDYSSEEEIKSASIKIQSFCRLDQASCAYCGNIVLRNNFHIDHIIPIKRGGKHAGNNLAISCASCNLSKSAKLLFLEWIPPILKIEKMENSRYLS
jgi:5-methylcytosine-specific restriction endonuclease McrA